MLSPQLLEELRQQLLDEQSRLRAELTQLGHRTNVKGVEDYDATHVEYDRDEEANALESRDDAAREQSTQTLESRLKDVDDALVRMDQGEYGKDETTGEMMSEERLRANPAARSTV